MASAQRQDPVLAYNFRISLVDSSSSLAESAVTVTIGSAFEEPDAGFNECTGLEMSLEVEEYMAGGNNAAILKFPTRKI